MPWVFMRKNPRTPEKNDEGGAVGTMTMAIPIPAAILFFCAAAMTFMAVRRLRAGQRGRALFNLLLAAFMAIFAWGYLG